jgi:hypothetical protein
VAGVSATELAEHLSLTRQRITVLAPVEHVLERLPAGKFRQPRQASVAGARQCIGPGRDGPFLLPASVSMSKEAFNIFAILVGLGLPIALVIVAFML